MKDSPDGYKAGGACVDWAACDGEIHVVADFDGGAMTSDAGALLLVASSHGY